MKVHVHLVFLPYSRGTNVNMGRLTTQGTAGQKEASRSETRMFRGSWGWLLIGWLVGGLGGRFNVGGDKAGC